MDFEVYCDETLQDLFTSDKPRANFVMIGGLWVQANIKNEIKNKINHIKKRHNAWGEIKWTKISPSKLDFYLELIDLFCCHGNVLRFRCIAIDNKQFDIKLHENDGELGFYKFYYQLLHHWIIGSNKYRIFCDTKTNRDPKRIYTLRRCLNHANIMADIIDVQALPSRQVVLIQLCDLLLGAASSRINETLNPNSAKEEVVKYLENKLCVDRIRPTGKDESKFNVFKIQLQGGR